MNNNIPKQLKVKAFLDGRPGHEKQTEGIQRALSKRVDLKVEYIKVPYNSLISDLILFFKIAVKLANKSNSGYQEPDYICLGTGRRTHLQMLDHKARFTVPVVICMSPLSLYRNLFDLCFVPRHDDIEEGGNVFLTDGPPNCSVNTDSHKPDCGLIVLGGVDNKTHEWRDEEIMTAIEELLVKDDNIQWTLSTSPRTPESSVKSLEKLEKLFPHCRLFEFKDTKPGWIEEQYSMNRYVWVTPDSMSMVYEALSAGCQVGLLPLTWKNSRSKFAKSEDHLVERGLARSFQQWKEGETAVKESLPGLDESSRCADEIVRRWCKS